MTRQAVASKAGNPEHPLKGIGGAMDSSTP